MKAMYTAAATSIGGRDGHVKSSDGVLDFEVKKPKEMGGKGGPYTNPEQLFAAGYSSCFLSALSHVALLRKLRIQSTVTAHVSIGPKDEGEGFQLAVRMDVNIPGIDLQLAEELAQAAHQLCPYSNATRGNIEVDIVVSNNA